MNIKNLPIGNNYPGIINAFIEIPKHSRNKYEYDEKLDIMKLDRILHSLLIYPGDYGFIPQTLALDGDHLDVLVLTGSPSEMGCTMEVRPVAVLKMKDGKDIDDKIIAVQTSDPRYEDLKDLNDLREHYLLEVRHFFEEYKRLENKKVQITGFEDKKSAQKIIENSHTAYRNNLASN